MACRPRAASVATHLTCGFICAAVGVVFELMLLLHPPFFVPTDASGGDSTSSLLFVWQGWQGFLFASEIWGGFLFVVTGAVGLAVRIEPSATGKCYRILSLLNVVWSLAVIVLNAYFVIYMVFVSDFFPTQEGQLWLLIFPCAGVIFGLVELVTTIASYRNVSCCASSTAGPQGLYREGPIATTSAPASRPTFTLSEPSVLQGPRREATPSGLVHQVDCTSQVTYQQTPRYPQYASSTQRRSTFSNWIYEPCASRLVEAGFFYRGPDDAVACFSCGINLNDWHPNDDPFFKHARWSETCPFVLKEKGPDYVAAVGATVTDIMDSLSTILAAFIDPQMPGPHPSDPQPELLPNNISSFQIGHETTQPIATSANNTAEGADTMDRLTCKICMDNQISIAFRPCGHMCVCQDCANRLFVCPICRSNVQEKHTTYVP